MKYKEIKKNKEEKREYVDFEHFLKSTTYRYIVIALILVLLLKGKL